MDLLTFIALAGLVLYWAYQDTLPDVPPEVRALRAENKRLRALIQSHRETFIAIERETASIHKALRVERVRRTLRFGDSPQLPSADSPEMRLSGVQVQAMKARENLAKYAEEPDHG